MIVDHFKHIQHKEFDVCIVGSGIGAASLASTLSKHNVRCLIIEAGNYKISKSPEPTFENIGLPFGLRNTCAIAIGGTSNLWHGVLAPFDPIDFEKREWIPNSGWPISYQELLPFYKQAAELLGLENFEYYKYDNLSSDLRDSAKALLFNRTLLDNKIFMQKRPPKNFKSTLLNLCKDSQEQHLIYNCNALEIMHNGHQVTGIKVGYPDGSTQIISTSLCIVSAGALQSPRLLLNSHIQNQNLGHYLMDHPMGNLCQLEVKRPKKYPIYTDARLPNSTVIKSGFTMRPELQKQLRLPNHNFYIRPSFVKGIHNKSEELKLSLLAIKDGQWSWKDIFALCTNPNVVRQIVQYKLSSRVTLKYADIFYVTEQIPSYNSYVGLSKQKDKWGYPISAVNWQLCEEDIASVERCFQLIHQQFFPENVFTPIHKETDFYWEQRLSSAAHHLGTVRMGSNEKSGVVDDQLKIFGLKNLYVCDASVMTTAGNANCGLTIAALAIRLGHHLARNISCTLQ